MNLNFFSIHFLASQDPEKNQITLEKIVLTVGQNNYENKMPFLLFNNSFCHPMRW